VFNVEFSQISQLAIIVHASQDLFRDVVSRCVINGFNYQIAKTPSMDSQLRIGGLELKTLIIGAVPRWMSLGVVGIWTERVIRQQEWDCGHGGAKHASPHSYQLLTFRPTHVMSQFG